MPSRISPLAITAFTVTCAAGRGRDAFACALQSRTSGLRENDLPEWLLPCQVGRVSGIENAPLPAAWAEWESRNHRLAWMALNEDGFRERALAAIERYGAPRVALILGTSTSSIGETEHAYRELGADGRFVPAWQHRRVHETHALAAFVRQALQLRGPSMTIATACSSSAKVFASAQRLIQAGIVDAAIVGGADTLCGSVLYGFNALELVSREPCRPFDVARSGLSLGEAAGFALLESISVDKSALRLTGYGESADAHHMSAPHPQGLGAERAMREAPARPTAAALAAGERRRAPESVLIAVEAATQACTMAGREPCEIPHVFTSAYGDLAINDYLCATLARVPGDVSPTKFHNSVHNAPAGYWAIASGCMRASTAVSAGAASFGAGLLDAAVRACGEVEPVLFVAYDLAACGPLRDTIASRSTFASAFVLAPWSPRARPHAPISVPLSWNRLTAKLDPQVFTIATARPLLKRTDPWKEMEKSARPLAAARKKIGL